MTLFVLNISFGQVQFGLKAGLNVANIKDESPNNSQSRIGYHFGGLLQWKLADKLLLRPELLYSVKGYRSPSIQFEGTATTSLNYVNLPILFGFRPVQNLLVLAGPELGYLTSAKSKLNRTSRDVSNIYREFDIGADLGLAYEATRNIGIELRYNYGFKGLVNVVYADQNGNITGQGKTGANRVFQIGVCYLLTK